MATLDPTDRRTSTGSVCAPQAALNSLRESLARSIHLTPALLSHLFSRNCLDQAGIDAVEATFSLLGGQANKETITVLLKKVEENGADAITQLADVLRLSDSRANREQGEKLFQEIGRLSRAAPRETSRQLSLPDVAVTGTSEDYSAAIGTGIPRELLGSGSSDLGIGMETLSEKHRITAAEGAAEMTAIQGAIKRVESIVQPPRDRNTLRRSRASLWNPAVNAHLVILYHTSFGGKDQAECRSLVSAVMREAGVKLGEHEVQTIDDLAFINLLHSPAQPNGLETYAQILVGVDKGAHKMLETNVVNHLGHWLNNCHLVLVNSRSSPEGLWITVRIPLMVVPRFYETVVMHPVCVGHLVKEASCVGRRYIIAIPAISFSSMLAAEEENKSSDDDSERARIVALVRSQEKFLTRADMDDLLAQDSFEAAVSQLSKLSFGSEARMRKLSNTVMAYKKSTSLPRQSSTTCQAETVQDNNHVGDSRPYSLLASQASMESMDGGQEAEMVVAAAGSVVEAEAVAEAASDPRDKMPLAAIKSSVRSTTSPVQEMSLVTEDSVPYSMIGPTRAKRLSKTSKGLLVTAELEYIEDATRFLKNCIEVVEEDKLKHPDITAGLAGLAAALRSIIAFSQQKLLPAFQKLEGETLKGLPTVFTSNRVGFRGYSRYIKSFLQQEQMLRSHTYYWRNVFPPASDLNSTNNFWVRPEQRLCDYYRALEARELEREIRGAEFKTIKQAKDIVAYVILHGESLMELELTDGYDAEKHGDLLRQGMLQVKKGQALHTFKQYRVFLLSKAALVTKPTVVDAATGHLRNKVAMVIPLEKYTIEKVEQDVKFEMRCPGEVTYYFKAGKSGCPISSWVYDFLRLKVELPAVSGIEEGDKKINEVARSRSSSTPSSMGNKVVVFRPEAIPYESLGPIVGGFLFFVATELRQLCLYVFYGAILIHVGEGTYAYTVCREIGMSSMATFLWTLQSFVVGFPSLLLLRRHRQHCVIMGRKLQ